MGFVSSTRRWRSLGDRLFASSAKHTAIMCKLLLFMLIIKYKNEQQPVGSLAALTLKWHRACVLASSGDPSGHSLSCELRIVPDLIPGDTRDTADSFLGFLGIYQPLL